MPALAGNSVPGADQGREIHPLRMWQFVRLDIDPAHPIPLAFEFLHQVTANKPPAPQTNAFFMMWFSYVFILNRFYFIRFQGVMAEKK